MKRIESPELKEYLIDYTVVTLGACRLFTKVYGKGFVRKRLNTNLDKVYVETYNDMYAGQYDFSDNSITISNPEGKTDFFTTLDLKDDDMADTKTTILHEAIHAILKRTPEECIDRQITIGTGLYEMYPNGIELGRGLNEGLTNWICKKAGLTPKSYQDLTKIIELLEIAVGEEKIIELGKGDIERNASKQLNMGQEETISFLAKADEIYHIQRKILEIRNIIEMLERLQQLAESKANLSPDEKQEANDIIKKLRENKIFTKMIGSVAFKQFQETQNKEKSIGKLKLFFTERLEKKEKKLNNQVCSFKEEIFNKYFKKETEKIMSSRRISSKLRKRLETIYQLLDIDRYEQINYWEEDYNSYRFAIRYKRLNARRNSHKILKSNFEQEESKYPALKSSLFSRILSVMRKILGEKLAETNNAQEKNDTKQRQFRQKVVHIGEGREKTDSMEKKLQKEEWERD